MDSHIYASVSDAEVESYWRIYFKDTNVSHNYELACLVEKALFEYGTVDVAVVVLTDGDKVKGIFPISHEIHDDGRNFWTYYPSLTFIAGSVTIDEECWAHLPEILPRPFLLQESSWKDYHDGIPLWVTRVPSNVIDISSSNLEEYLASLSKKHRSKLRNCLNRNEDIRVVIGEPVNGEFNTLKEVYQDHCYEKYKKSNEICYFLYQLKVFPLIFDSARKSGQLIVLRFYLEDTLVAVNYSIKNGDTICDYICYRDPSLVSRSLGLFAILENIRHIQEHHPECKYYDLASEFDYKSKFLNCEKSHAVFTLE